MARSDCHRPRAAAPLQRRLNRGAPKRSSNSLTHMTHPAEVEYRLRFSRRADGNIDVSLHFRIADATHGNGHLGWITDASQFDVGPDTLTDAQASDVLHQLERALALLASIKAEERRGEPLSLDDEHAPAHACQSQLRVRGQAPRR